MPFSDSQQDYQKFREMVAKMDDDELIDNFNSETGSGGWTGSRVFYLTAIFEEMEKRNVKIEKKQ